MTDNIIYRGLLMNCPFEICGSRGNQKVIFPTTKIIVRKNGMIEIEKEEK